jgi:hypothetical protein
MSLFGLCHGPSHPVANESIEHLAQNSERGFAQPSIGFRLMRGV